MGKKKKKKAKGFGQFKTMVERRVQVEPTLSDAHSYITAVKEAFHDEPTKYEEFIKLMNDIRDHG